MQRRPALHTLLGLCLLLLSHAALAQYACPDRSDRRGGWLPEACQQALCADCGVVEAVTEFSEDGKASGLGAAAGAVAGGLLGNQVGSGKGRTLATIIGAVGGGVAGHYGEKKLRGKKHWEVAIRMQDGSSRTVSLEQPPELQVGDHVRFEGDNLVRE